MLASAGSHPELSLENRRPELQRAGNAFAAICQARFEARKAAAVLIHRSCLLAPMLVLMLAWLLVATAVDAVLARSGSPEPEIHFDIPAQALAQALDAYSAATGREVFYDGASGAGRRSAEVKGAFTPDDALKILLSGTEFVVSSNGSSGYTLLHAPEKSARVVAAARMASDRQYTRYFAIIQANIRTALCRNAETRPGAERFLFKFWIAPSGAVARSELTGPAGNQARDTALVATLQSLIFDEPPPALMPQPITMVVFPRDAAACGPAKASARPVSMRMATSRTAVPALMHRHEMSRHGTAA